MSSALQFFVERALAGTWEIVWHWGLGVGLLILCAAGAWFVPLVRKDFIFAAIAVLIWLIGEASGIHDYKAHVEAQQAKLTEELNKVIQSTETPSAKKERDPFNRKDY